MVLIACLPFGTLLWAQHQLAAEGRRLELSMAGLDLDAFTVVTSGAAEHWVPQLVFLLLFVGLGYAVLRASPRRGPTARGVLLVVAAALLAGAVSDLTDVVLERRAWSGPPTWDDVDDILGTVRAYGEATAFAPWVAVTLLAVWLEWRLLSCALWTLRRLPQLRHHTGLKPLPLLVRATLGRPARGLAGPLPPPGR
ncbi:hypothetical protein EBN88_17100, partial [Streptomyces triticirhizae]